jgi:hypothetical protein
VNPFRLTVYNKAFGRRGWVGAPLRVSATVRHNAVSVASFTIDGDHPRAADLLAPGARVVVEYDGAHLLGGPVRTFSGAGPAASAVLTFGVEDDFRLLSRILGWPVPTAGLDMQTAEYDVRTGAAETVAKDVILANATRLGLPVTAEPSQARGASVTASFRFHPIADRLLALIDQAGVGLTVRQSGAGLVVGAYAPRTHPRPLSEASGVVTSWEWSREGPKATRAVAGGKGEGTSRTFYGPHADTALESEWGDVIEVFVDARNTADSVKAYEQMATALAEGAPTAGLKVTLSETDAFRYGRSVRVGDRVRLEAGPGLVVEDVLREVVLSWDARAGLTVEPVVGERTEPARIYARALSTLARGLRNLNAGR